MSFYLVKASDGNRTLYMFMDEADVGAAIAAIGQEYPDYTVEVLLVQPPYDETPAAQIEIH